MDYNIKTIKGDTLELDINFDIDNNLISQLQFSCRQLNINENFTYNSTEDNWKLSISSEQTILFNTGCYDYDITVRFHNNSVLTAIYRGKFSVLPKENSAVWN